MTDSAGNFRRGFTPRIEDYAMIGDGHSAALVSSDGSIDWFCQPRFDSPACFAAMLGTEKHGSWRIAPSAPTIAVGRRYEHGALILRTEFETASGRAAVVDFMPWNAAGSTIIRIAEGLHGDVPMHMTLRPRFAYGANTPYVTRRAGGGVRLADGTDSVELHASVPVCADASGAFAAFTVVAGQSVSFVLSAGPAPMKAVDALHATRAAWLRWRQDFSAHGPYADAVLGSAVVLKALAYAPTGAIVAAPTTSLPEQPGGTRNWDYRYCWLRDSAFAVTALLRAGFTEEARAWRAWLHRNITDRPDAMRVLYDVAGDNPQPERELPWLPGYGGARPVRVGNAAADQFQLDVPGEVLDALLRCRRAGMAADTQDRVLEDLLARHVFDEWDQPDEGIWEVRGGRQRFTFSRAMAWVALDRAIRGAEAAGHAVPISEWKRLRSRIHESVCAEGFSRHRNSFVQVLGGNALDASLLLLPAMGFLPADDPRMLGTVGAIERELILDGFVLRYRDDAAPDGLPPGEGAFLACSFWLVDNYVMQGRMDDARALFDRLLAVRNDVGLLAEQYDPRARRMTGNVPQALSHAALILSADRLAGRAAAS